MTPASQNEFNRAYYQEETTRGCRIHIVVKAENIIALHFAMFFRD
jgi:hypothetical protein